MTSLLNGGELCKNGKLVISFLSDQFEDFTRGLLKYIVFEMILYLRIHVIF